MKLKQFLLIILGLTFGFSKVNAQKNPNYCGHDVMQAKKLGARSSSKS